MNDVCLMFVFFLRGSTPHSVSALLLPGALALPAMPRHAEDTTSRGCARPDGVALTTSRGRAGPS